MDVVFVVMVLMLASWKYLGEPALATVRCLQQRRIDARKGIRYHVERTGW